MASERPSVKDVAEAIRKMSEVVKAMSDELQRVAGETAQWGTQLDELVSEARRLRRKGK